jgi:hypothetical protein
MHDKIIQALSKLGGIFKGTYHPIDKISEDDKKLLKQDIFDNADKFNEAAFLHRDWPEGRGLFFNSSKSLVI